MKYLILEQQVLYWDYRLWLDCLAPLTQVIRDGMCDTESFQFTVYKENICIHEGQAYGLLSISAEITFASYVKRSSVLI